MQLYTSVAQGVPHDNTTVALWPSLRVFAEHKGQGCDTLHLLFCEQIVIRAFGPLEGGMDKDWPSHGHW